MFGPVRIWARYLEDSRAVNKWEIVSDGYSIQRHRNGSHITIHLEHPSSRQDFPTSCGGCIPIAGVSISAKNAFDSAKITFKLIDPRGKLPPPFPAFESWARLAEDEYVQ